jgi:hypothetical protein
MDYLSPSMTPLRRNEEAGVYLYEVKQGCMIEYQVYDCIHSEILYFPADQRDDAIKTYEQMRQRKV